MTEIFVANDHSVAIIVTAAVRNVMLGYCARATQLETGGILIGHYTPLGDQAVITQVVGPPGDSLQSRWSFIRGLHGLQGRIDRAWRRGDYYLGEWHFHPFAPPTPSAGDRSQIVMFSKDPAYQCPEAILIVVGGSPAGGGDLWIGVVLQGGLQELQLWQPPLLAVASPCAVSLGTRHGIRDPGRDCRCRFDSF